MLNQALRTSNDGVDIDATEGQVSKFSQQTIEHPPFVEASKILIGQMIAARHSRHRPRGALIYGPSGAGKTTLCNRLVERFPRYDTEDRTIIPVLYVELPSQPTTKVIAEAILSSLGDPRPHTGTAEERIKRAIKLIAACSVELILIDEVQHISDNLDGRMRNIAADSLKSLMNATGIPFVFLGLPSASTYFSSQIQLGRRLNPKINLCAYPYKTATDQDAFARLLLTFDRKLPFDKESSLVDPDLVERLHFASFGLIGILSTLVEGALRIALQSKADTLNRDHLRLAFRSEVFIDCKPQRNPFDEKFNMQPLVSAGEPFYGFRS